MTTSRTQERRQTFMCFLCSADQTFNVNPGWSTRQAQQVHHTTMHSRVLREAIGAIIHHLGEGTSLVVYLEPDAPDDRTVRVDANVDMPVHNATTSHLDLGCTHDSMRRCTHMHTHTHPHG